MAKSGKDKSIDRGLGSIDLTGACRSLLLVGRDPDQPRRLASGTDAWLTMGDVAIFADIEAQTGVTFDDEWQRIHRVRARVSAPVRAIYLDAVAQRVH